jgi:hypothetical protein
VSEAVNHGLLHPWGQAAPRACRQEAARHLARRTGGHRISHRAFAIALPAAAGQAPIQRCGPHGRCPGIDTQVGETGSRLFERPSLGGPGWDRATNGDIKGGGSIPAGAGVDVNMRQAPAKWKPDPEVAVVIWHVAVCDHDLRLGRLDGSRHEDTPHDHRRATGWRDQGHLHGAGAGGPAAAGNHERQRQDAQGEAGTPDTTIHDRLDDNRAIPVTELHQRLERPAECGRAGAERMLQAVAGACIGP